MKKVLILGCAFACMLSGYAQRPMQTAKAVRVEKAQATVVRKMKNTAELKVAGGKLLESAVKAERKSLPVMKAEENDVFLSGSFTIKGYDPTTREDVKYSFNITPDETVSGKYWFDNILGQDFGDKIELKPVYATLNGTKLTFPAAQVIVSKLALTGGTMSDLTLATYTVSGNQLVPDLESNITAEVNEEEGTITFSPLLGGLPDVSSALSGTLCADGIAYSQAILPFEPAYTVPEGTLYYGMTAEGVSYLYTFIGCAAPGRTWNWNAICEDATDAATYEWMYYNLSDASSASTPITTTGKSLSFEAKAGEAYTFPLLMVTEGKKEGVYMEGMQTGYNPETETINSLIQAGGTSVQLEDETGTPTGEMLNLSNASLEKGIAVERQPNGSFLFGTGNVGGDSNPIYLDGVIARYENPNGKLSFDGVDVYCGAYSNPNNVKLKLSVVKISKPDKDGEYDILETVCESEKFTVESHAGEEESGVTSLKFRDFVKKDGEFEDIVTPVLTSDFALVLTGFKQEGLSLGVISEKNNGLENYVDILVNQGEESIITSWIGMDVHLWMMLHDCVLEGAEGSGIVAPEAQSSQTRVFTTSDAFNFTYPADFTSVEVYNVNGQKVSTYALPQTGSFSIAKSELNDGVYLFRMNGKTTEVLRAVK